MVLFSSPELLRLLLRQKSAPAAGEIEELHVKNQPAIVRSFGTARGSPARLLCLNCFHVKKIDIKTRDYERAVD
jgi:hypothetical protein